MAVLSNVMFSFWTILIIYSICVSCNESDNFNNYESHVTSPQFTKEKGYDVLSLLPNQRSVRNNKDRFSIFCYENYEKSLIYIWKTVQLEIERAPLNYRLFSGENETEVYDKYLQSSILSPSSWLGFYERGTVIDFPAFSSYCIGMSTEEDYVLYLKIRSINYWKLLQMIIGLLVFLSAPSLSKNSFFHYTSGVSIGVFASVLILIFVISRILPKKSASYAVLIFGYSFVLYVLQAFWKEIYNTLINFKDFVLAYCLVAAVISFFVCYRFGPVKNPRTFNLIQWLMQLVAVLLIFFSSEYREVPTALIIILFSVNIIPSSWISFTKRIWFRYFPPKLKLLTELEYIEQGSIETKKALESLKNYCSSPDCNAWKVISRLKDPVSVCYNLSVDTRKPFVKNVLERLDFVFQHRFASFIEKGSHFTDEEMLEYNSEDIFGDGPGSDTDSEENYTDVHEFSSNHHR